MKIYALLLTLLFSVGAFAQILYTDNRWQVNELVFARDNNKKISDPTAFRIRNTDTYFEVDIRLEGSHWKMLQSVPFKMRAVGWPREESVELFFDPGRKCSKYLHIAAGVNGSVYDKRFTSSLSKWSAKWTVTRQDYKGGVILKFHIPYDSDFKKPEKGEVWGFNICRNVKNDTPYFSTFAKVGGRFDNPAKFAELRFGSQKEFFSAAMEKNRKLLSEVRKEIRKNGWEPQFAVRLEKLEKNCTEMDIRFLQDEMKMLKAMKEMAK